VLFLTALRRAEILELDVGRNLSISTGVHRFELAREAWSQLRPHDSVVRTDNSSRLVAPLLNRISMSRRDQWCFAEAALMEAHAAFLFAEHLRSKRRPSGNQSERVVVLPLRLGNDRGLRESIDG